MEIAAAVFVIFLITVGTITFFILKKAFKMAIRAAIVALILLIAIAGGISLWLFSEKGTGSGGGNTRPANNSTKSTR